MRKLMKTTFLTLLVFSLTLYSQPPANQTLIFPTDTTSFTGMFTKHNSIPVGDWNPLIYGDVDNDKLEEWYGIKKEDDTLINCFEENVHGVFNLAETYNGSHVFDLKDIDYDGLTELIVQDENYKTFTVYEPVSINQLPSRIQLSTDFGCENFTFHIYHGFTDLDCDGKYDVLTGNGTCGSFRKGVQFIEYDYDLNKFHLNVVDSLARVCMFDYGDVNNDGKLEAVGVFEPHNEVMVYENVGNNSFTQTWKRNFNIAE